LSFSSPCKKGAFFFPPRGFRFFVSLVRIRPFFFTDRGLCTCWPSRPSFFFLPELLVGISGPFWRRFPFFSLPPRKLVPSFFGCFLTTRGPLFPFPFPQAETPTFFYAVLLVRGGPSSSAISLPLLLHRAGFFPPLSVLEFLLRVWTFGRNGLLGEGTNGSNLFPPFFLGIYDSLFSREETLLQKTPGFFSSPFPQTTTASSPRNRPPPTYLV